MNVEKDQPQELPDRTRQTPQTPNDSPQATAAERAREEERAAQEQQPEPRIERYRER